MYALENVLRPYAWGSPTAIAGLLGRPASGGPEAELWIGAHPDSPSTAAGADDGGPLALDALIAGDPDHFLGSESIAAFGPRLPFLLKVLAADHPLSLQVHPTLEQARAGFAREEAAGVDRSAATRNYKDDNHKPEMIFALTPFDALCGFRPAAASRAVFEDLARAFEQAGREVPALLPQLVGDLARPEEDQALRAAFERLIGGGDDVAAATAAVVELLAAGTPDGPDAAALDTVGTLNAEYPGDPGVLISLLLNRISLAPGEAVYLPAGNVHAYLHGLGIEVMASSDNVLRGGLTPKFVDVPELLQTIAFEAVGVPELRAEQTMLGQELYRPPFQEFALQRIELAPGGEAVPLAQSGAAVLIVVAGSVMLDSPKGDLRLDRGGSAFVPAAEAPVNVHPAGDTAEPAVVFAVTTGMKA